MADHASRIPESDLYLFNHGELKRAWQVLGAHELPDGAGVRFALWAPYALRVSVVGDFNRWKGPASPLEKRGSTGVWETVVPNAKAGDLYKFDLTDSTGKLRRKADPFGFRMELRPNTASMVWPLHGFPWKDAEWLAARARRLHAAEPMRIYEMHLGSWRKGRSYRDLATELVDYLVATGFTHVEFLPISEHPYDASWGYQVCGYFAASSRWGTPQELMGLIDALHAAGIGVLLDWVPAHFPKDEHGLAQFDGTHLFEHEDPRRGVHKDWDTLIFNYERPEVRNFLVSNALFWLEVFHFDGLRVDAVASMLYRDYSREEGEWLPNEHGGREDLSAIAFLRELNEELHAEAPGILTIAEESTAFPGVTKPVHLGGLGFDFKWNMGWMHDTLAFLEKDPIHRPYHHDRLTFALYYAFQERYLLPLSHDEVVHLKKSLLAKMPGDAWKQHATLRLLHAWQAAHPGKSLLFMGGEIGEWKEWNHDGELDWPLLEDARHAGLRLLVGDLNSLVRERPALHELDHDWRGFEWVDFSDMQKSVVSLVRWNRKRDDGVLFAFNFTPVVREGYRIGVRRSGSYREVLNTDSACYGGSGVGNLGSVSSEPVEQHGHPHSLVVTLPRSPRSPSKSRRRDRVSRRQGFSGARGAGEGSGAHRLAAAMPQVPARNSLPHHDFRRRR
ncbi:MAG: 1,4-alpha-glucan branching protein GlgB [Planctomycetes bacterium]|nr:1,4-alpha-glucan branching protein GlgB [Planctomycetota bacterium]